MNTPDWSDDYNINPLIASHTWPTVEQERCYAAAIHDARLKSQPSIDDREVRWADNRPFAVFELGETFQRSNGEWVVCVCARPDHLEFRVATEDDPVKARLERYVAAAEASMHKPFAAYPLVNGQQYPLMGRIAAIARKGAFGEG